MATDSAFPDDVVLIIIENLDIDTFLDFRQTCCHYRALISSHMDSLSLAVARTTFPTQTRIFESNPQADHDDRTGMLRWLKWLRYEQLAAILVERISPQPISAEDPVGDELRHGVAHGWHIIAHLQKLVEEMGRTKLDDLVQPSTAPVPTNDHAPLPLDQAERRTRGLDICSKLLRFVQTWTLNELKGYKFIIRSLVLDIFGLQSQGPLASPDICQWDCVAWLITHIIQLGPQRFWQQWWKNSLEDGHKPDFHTQSLAHDIESAWHSVEKPLLAWELDAPRLIDRQIDFIMIIIKSVVALSYSKRLEKHRCLFCFQSGYFGGVWLGAKTTPSDEPGTPFVFGAVPIAQHLDWELLGEGLEHPFMMSMEERRRRRDPSLQRPREARKEDPTSKEAMALYAEWREEWLGTCSI
ncbi:hypothetical protein PRZ48_009791 [Zasmidium cellare]|uniref:F-box domain-containing protein n=1 Tax=Zasmidium cellare TaxID=395010 RepID=A0ABR0EDK7_ZASCE|nr:hypothetical protein PRZ48_009791 [Zasmidium cellare]